VAADDVLAVAIGQAGDGTWERLAVARALYLGGERDRGQLLIDSVLKGKPEASDLRRALQIYGEAEEWDKALPIADQLVAMAPQDADDLAQAGAWCNVAGQREKAEALFTRALASDDSWGGSHQGPSPRPRRGRRAARSDSRGRRTAAPAPAVVLRGGARIPPGAAAGWRIHDRRTSPGATLTGNRGR